MPKEVTGSVYRSCEGYWVAKISFSDPSTIDPQTGKPKRRWRKARATSRAAACSKRDKLLDDYRAGRSHAPESVRTFTDLALDFIDKYVKPPVYQNGQKLAGMADHKGVRSIIEKILIPSLGHRSLLAITHPELRALRDRRLKAPKLRGGKKIVTLDGESRSLARVNREMAVARMVFNHGVDLNVIARNPMIGPKRRSLVLVSAENARERVLTYEEEKRLLKNYVKLAKRTVDVFVVAIDTGLRWSELYGLEVRDIDFGTGVIAVRWEIAKSKRARQVPISRRVRAILKRRCRSAEPSLRIFQDLSYTVVRNDLRKVRAAAKVDDFRLHDARATFASRLLAAGISEAEIARLTGHMFRRQLGEKAAAPTLRKHYLRPDRVSFDRVGSILDKLAKDQKLAVN